MHVAHTLHLLIGGSRPEKLKHAKVEQEGRLVQLDHPQAAMRFMKLHVIFKERVPGDGRWVEEDSKKREEEAEDSEITKALV